MTEIIPVEATNLFNFGTKKVRIHKDDQGNPWFVAVDVCNALEIKNSRDALSSLNDNFKGVANTDTMRGKRKVATINEAGLFAFIFRSRKAGAKAFQDWVTAVVLPTLGQDGLYIVGEEKLIANDMTPQEVHQQFEHLTAEAMQRLEEKAARLTEAQEEKLARREAFRIINQGRKSKPRKRKEYLVR